MRGKRLTVCLVLILPFVLGVGWSAASAAESDFPLSVLEIEAGHSRLVQLPVPIKRVSVGDEKVADVLVITPRQLYINGRAIGNTNISLWGPSNKLMGVFDVRVGRDLTRLKERLHELMPGEPVEVRELEGVVVLSGLVSNARAKNRAEAVAKAFAPEKMTSLIEVGGNQQVMLQVRFAEVNRRSLKRLTVNLGFLDIGGNFFSTFIDGLTSVADTPTGLSYSSNMNMMFGVNVGEGKLTGFLEALKENGLAKILAEPNLVASSGEEASFLAGGEFPVPVPQKDYVTILFKQFGVQLKFKPEVLDGGRIRLMVAPEVSELDTSTAVVIQGFVIPGLTTRQAKTQLELDDGQSFAMAGLLRDDLTQVVSRVPLLGDIPILGALFRSTKFQSGKTELVIVVTPRIIKPGEGAPGRMPTEGLHIPDDFDLYLLGDMVTQDAAPEMPSRSLRELEGEFGHDYTH